VVLEELTSLASPDGEAGVVVVATNLRDLADAVGLGRDAVAGALQALALAGWVRSETSRGSRGRFGAGRYLVSSSSAPRRLPAGVPTRPPRAVSTTTTSPQLPQLPQQLSLLDLSSTPNVPSITTATTTP
jgi:DNA-binding transcriptional MocR family regulator